MPKTVELRRHTANEGDVLTAGGIAAAVEVGRRLEGPYDLLVSSGAQRATQSLACFLAGLGERHPGGVVVEPRFVSEKEDRWFRAYERSGAGDLASFTEADPELVAEESERFAAALADVFGALPEGGKALVVGHSPMNEAAVYGLTGVIVDPVPKGAGVRVTRVDGGYEVVPLH